MSIGTLLRMSNVLKKFWSFGRGLLRYPSYIAEEQLSYIILSEPDKEFRGEFLYQYGVHEEEGSLL